MYDATLTVARDTTHSPALPRDATVPDLYSHLPRHLATENETALSTSPSSTESPLFESPHHSSPDLHSLPDGRNALPILGGEDVHAHAEFVDPVPCEDGCPPKSESLREPDEDITILEVHVSKEVLEDIFGSPLSFSALPPPGSFISTTLPPHKSAVTNAVTDIKRATKSIMPSHTNVPPMNPVPLLALEIPLGNLSELSLFNCINDAIRPILF
ncbi:hypothetical protein NLI96_g6419 [Meripilus lineatus]|uniref:Uncharacterized protein n=1 Tax=Meripilus lineatus TaxID=2056292 RepID=A0AAD5YI28_9APHY|nr:hypothetical protein NLI96_g6419 [Physisporinus lineatus]